MPQNRISICTSQSVGSRRLIFVDASPDVALAAENAFALYVVGCMFDDCPLYCGSQRNLLPRLVTRFSTIGHGGHEAHRVQLGFVSVISVVKSDLRLVTRHCSLLISNFGLRRWMLDVERWTFSENPDSRHWSLVTRHFLYCSSLTFSIHSTTFPSSAS